MKLRFPGWHGLMLILVLVAACEGPISEEAAKPQVVDPDAERASLIQADLDFGDTALQQGLAPAYLQFLADDAVQLPDGDLPIEGRDAIYENILLATEDGSFSLSWEPVAAEVSASGDLGYTWGGYRFEAQDESGQPVSYEGKYANFWRKSAKGRWQIVLDISNQNQVAYEFYGDPDFDPNADGVGYDDAGLTNEAL
ncbi:MAG: DUF4440 domain-containing protein [Gammaproteobacteria bacterium]|nr:DUF4440 domain-containing protein [Gammaproteobacteria bacterium]MDP6616718.1 DUF4440 domain-containing protein [Gammaproteobacteria bacterium]MDP6695217.1 DUF4440 domain-containing protein [Gammaproteobacteria bacterium]MDP7041189.1 DUF4440 domain-containing protein [Gammaproteobacteria bacterium]